MKIHEVTYMDGDVRQVINLQIPKVERIEFGRDIYNTCVYSGTDLIVITYSDGFKRWIYNPCHILIED